MSSNIGLEPFQVHLACAYMQHSTFTLFCTSATACTHVPPATFTFTFSSSHWTSDQCMRPLATPTFPTISHNAQCSAVHCHHLQPTSFTAFYAWKIPCTSYLYSSCSGALIRNDCHTLIALFSASQSLHLH